MALKRHHKILIGSFSTLILILIITNSVFLYILFVKINLNYQATNDKIANLQSDSNLRINNLSENLGKTNEALNTTVLSINKQFDSLKASVGQDFSGIIDTSLKSVVIITTSAGQGTGFIISNDGYIVTNAHVIADSTGYLAKNIQAITYNQGTKNMQFVGYDGNLDVALLKIDGNYQPLALANSDNIKQGNNVLAIGNPYGLRFSTTEGTIANLDLNGDLKYLQLSVSLNPGNSGGPLINTEGKVIGMNSFKLSAGEGLGFAIKSNYIKNSINAISQSNLKQTLI